MYDSVFFNEGKIFTLLINRNRKIGSNRGSQSVLLAFGFIRSALAWRSFDCAVVVTDSAPFTAVRSEILYDPVHLER